jgi:hypothetical protein
LVVVAVVAVVAVVVIIYLQKGTTDSASTQLFHYLVSHNVDAAHMEMAMEEFADQLKEMLLKQDWHATHLIFTTSSHAHPLVCLLLFLVTHALFRSLYFATDQVVDCPLKSHRQFSLTRLMRELVLAGSATHRFTAR